MDVDRLAVRQAQMALDPAASALFERHPLAATVTISVGPVPTPYHVYDGYGVFIGGFADLDAARTLLEPEQVRPVQTTHGRALMGVWVFDFTDASLGAHHELQCSLFTSRVPLDPLPSHRLTLIESMLDRPGVAMLCHGLWNSTPEVVAYNRELLALDARRSESRIERSARTLRFRVEDREAGAPVVEGSIDQPLRASFGANLALTARLGLRRIAALARAPWIEMRVLNPVGPRLARNAAARTFTRIRASALRYFDPDRDHLAIFDERYRRLRFEPQFVQTMEGFRFVYLMPS